MTSDYFRRVFRAFIFAGRGIRDLIRDEKNSRIHLFFTAAVIIAGFLLHISAVEWSILVLTIGSVWSAEAMNSALERNVDLVTLEKKKLAGEAKDLAAAAVLILAMMSVVIGLVIFLPKLIRLFLY